MTTEQSEAEALQRQPEGDPAWSGTPSLAVGLEHSSKNPAVVYLLSLPSPLSRKTMTSLLNRVAQLTAETTILRFAWAGMQRHHVQGILALLNAAGLAPATINTYLAALKGVALESWSMKLIDAETYQQIKAVKSVRGSRVVKGRALSQQEFGALYAACEAAPSPAGLRDAAMIALLAGCGLRRAEIVGVDIEHIDMADQSLRVLGKGNKERVAFVPQNVWQRLQRWLAELGAASGPAFRRIRREDKVTSERLTSQAVYHILKERQIQAGVKDFTPHDLRRTFASMLLANGEDIITVKDAMGHESVATTQKYDRRGDDRLREASKRLVV
ncbi:tyrosine-type recombinase/integrase [Streptomyces sp. G35A]